MSDKLSHPEPEAGEDPIKWYAYPWHWLQLFAWHLWPQNDCPYCWWYRGVMIGAILAALIVGGIAWLKFP